MKYLLALLLVGGLCAEEDPAFKVVNKEVSLGTYIPADIVTFKEVKMSKRIVADLKNLIEAARKDGLTLKPVSGYRSYKYQIGTFKRWTEREMKRNPRLTRKEAEELANTYSAKSGHSEHQLGTVVDLLSSENGYKFSITSDLKYVGWLEKNAEKFNFRISHHKNQTQFIYEPWHLRWYPLKK